MSSDRYEAALRIIRSHIAEAESERQFHSQRGRKTGNFDAMAAALKKTWLSQVLENIEKATNS